MVLDPDVASQVAHLFDATLAQVLSGEVPGLPAGPPLLRDDVVRTDGEIPGPGGPVPVRWYRSAALPEGAPAPALVWAHGGGWRYGDLSMPEADSVAQVVAADLPGVVVSVGYRLAPAHEHPAALDDLLAATTWVAREGGAHGIDTTRIALGGASAGAHLAAATALALAGSDIDLAALVLAYPVVDPFGGPYPDARDPDCPPLLWLDRDAIGAMFATYLGEADPDEASLGPTLVPARGDLGSLPPTLVTTSACDGLAPQGIAFAEGIAAAGGEVDHHGVEGVLHGYLNTLTGDVTTSTADRALARHVAWLRAALA